MSDKSKTLVIRGVLNYAKVLGDARPHTGNPKYDKGPSWTVDVTPDAKGLQALADLGLTEKLREVSDKDKNRVGRDDYLTLRVLEKRADGKTNDPPSIVDVRGVTWPKDKLIGNGSVADVKVRVVDYGKGVQKGVYLQALRILEHVPYEANAFAPLSEDDEYFSGSEPMTEPNDEWDDDVPA